MAIRDFGTSLLSNVRARKDAGQAEARDYARSQKNKDMRSAFFAPFLAEGIKGLFNAGNSAIAQKTQDFLANSNLQNNKILMSSVSKTVDQQVKDYGAAQEKDVSIPQYYLEDQADLEFEKLKVSKPLEYTDNNADYWKTWLMEQDKVISKATERADFNAEVMSRSTDFAAGKASARTLTSLATRQNIGLTKAVLNTLTGNTRSVDVFNDAMDNLSQIKIAKELYNLSTARLQSASKVVAASGDIKMGIESLGIDVTSSSYKKVLKDIEKGVKTTYDVSFSTDNSGQLLAVTQALQVGLEGKTVGPPVITTKKIGSPNKPLTSADLSSLAAMALKTNNYVIQTVGEEGLEDFLSVATAEGLIKPDMSMRDRIILNDFALDYNNYTKQENFIPPISESEAVGRAAYLKESGPLLKLIDNVNTSPAEKVALENQLARGLAAVGNAVLRGSNNPYTPEERPKVFRPLNLPADAKWSVKEKGWFVSDPNDPTKFKRVVL